MSEANAQFFPPDDPAEGADPFAQSLVDLRENILNGETVYGDPRSHRAEQRLAELDATIDFYRRIGSLPPDPGPPSADTVAERLLEQQFPGGPPSASLPAEHATFYRGKLDELAALPDQLLTARISAVAADFAHDAGRIGVPHLLANRRDPANARPIADGLVEDAEAVIAALAASSTEAAKFRRLIRADRSILETFAARGQMVEGYSRRRQLYGLGPAPLSYPGQSNGSQPRTHRGLFRSKRAS